MTRKAMLAMAAITATIPTLLFTTALAGEPVGGSSSIICNEQGVCVEHHTVQCRAPAWPWGGHDCWSKGEGRAFRGWLLEHGSSPRRFRERFPELARTFGPSWGVVKPDPWKDCAKSACVPAVIRHVFGQHAGYAIEIARCETGGTFNPRATGAAGERGVFQIHPVHFGSLDEGRLWEPLYNARVAYRMSGGGTDWGPWTCARYV